MKLLAMGSSKCGFQSSKWTNDLSSEVADHILNLHRDEVLILDDKNTPGLERSISAPSHLLRLHRLKTLDLSLTGNG